MAGKESTLLSPCGVRALGQLPLEALSARAAVEQAGYDAQLENSSMGYGLRDHVFSIHRIALHGALHCWRQFGLLEANNERIAPTNDCLEILVVGSNASTVPL